MTVLTQPWEHSLLSLANAGSADHRTGSESALETRREAPLVSTDLLERAYHYCAELTAAHSRSFHLASGLLPEAKKRAVRALYAFCRVTDDLVDRPGSDPAQMLVEWQATASNFAPPVDNLVAIAWADARASFHIPQHYAEQLINGVRRDLSQNRYETFEELAGYSYGVASTVGLMSMHIIGFTHSRAIPYAVKLGVALQLTNILRDVAEDWQNGRVYLPQEELRRFGLSDSDLQAGIVTDRWRAFMHFQVNRTRQLYQEALPGISLLHPDGRFAIWAAAGLYRAILDDIERHEFDVFTRRAFVSTAGKVSRLPALWWNSRRTDPDAILLAQPH